MAPKTFSIQTLGCRVNQYEAEQLATLLRARGLVPAGSAAADLRIVHTCSVTVQAAGKSRQTARRAATVPLTVLTQTVADSPSTESATGFRSTNDSRLLITGCWATSDPAAARAIPGVDAVITHHDDVAAELDQLLSSWQLGQPLTGTSTVGENTSGDKTSGETTLGENVVGENTPGGYREIRTVRSPQTSHTRNDETNESTGDPTHGFLTISKPAGLFAVNEKIAGPAGVQGRAPSSTALLDKPTANPVRGFAALPLLADHQTGRQRALLKIQDGCDAHCTYCIIPQLRPSLYSKSPDEAVEEARRLVDSGHVEIVLTGIFLGAYGQPTALRRRQPARRSPLADLVDALCTKVPGLRRLRLSSLEPGDLADDLLAALRSHEQVVPHFHLPLQSGSDRLLRKMNRQYGRDDFLRMTEQVHAAFDRPALTTDIIAGFPGETDDLFAETADVVTRARFIHVHAFHFSPRPKTAAARWQKDFVRGPVINERIETLRSLADQNSLAFRQSFVGQEVEVLVENDGQSAPIGTSLRHGRCERYFDVWFDAADSKPGDFLKVRVESATPTRTTGIVRPIIAHTDAGV